MIRLASVPHTGTLFTQAWMGIEMHRHISDPSVLDWITAGDLVVFPMRDPVLARISTINRSEVGGATAEKFNTLAGYASRENVHLFRVDCPAEERVDRVRALGQFIGRGLAYLYPVSWTPVNTTDDVTGLKRMYGAGHLPPSLRAFVDELDRSVDAMLEQLGYDLPWMRARKYSADTAELFQ